jgi:hypothetical protein
MDDLRGVNIALNSYDIIAYSTNVTICDKHKAWSASDDSFYSADWFMVDV